MLNRKNSLSLLVMLLLLGITLWVIFRGQDLQAIGEALSRARPGWLLLGLGCTGAFIGSEALGSYIALRAMGSAAPYRRCYAFSAAGFYFSSITPSSTGGQPAQVFYMTRLDVPAAIGALDMLLLSVCYQFATLVYALAAWALSPGLAASLGTGLGVLLGYGFTVTGLLTALIGLFLFRPGVARRLCCFFLSLGARLGLVRAREKVQAGLDRQMEEYRRGAGLIRAKPWLFPTLLGVTLLQMTFLYLVPWTVYRALGLAGAGAWALVSVQALLSLAVGCLPIPGAVGASEGAFLSAFQGLFTPSLTPAAMLLSRGLSFYLPLLLTGASVAVLHLKTAPRAAKSS